MTDIKESTECFIAGISAMDKVKKAEELIEQGNLEEAKTIVGEAMGFTKSGCLDENLSNKISQKLEGAIEKIENNEINEAKDNLISIATISLDS